MKQNNRKRHIIGLISIMFMVSIWGGGIVHSEQLLDHVTQPKVVGDRFSILDFNDIWTFIKGIFEDGSGNVGIGAEPSAGLKLDVTGKLGATDLCDEDGGLCRDLSDKYAFAAPRGAFVGKTTATTDGSAVSNGLAGYAAANDICNTEFVGTHLCSMSEIVATISTVSVWEEVAIAGACPTPSDYTFYANTLGDTNDNGTAEVGEFCVFTGWTGSAWVNGGASKYAVTTVHVDDCEGWTYDVGADHRGNFWNFDAGTVGTTSPKNGGAGGVTACNLALSLSCCR